MVVFTISQTDHPPHFILHNQIQSQVAISHRHDGINGVGVATADEITKFLIDDVLSAAVIVFWR